VRSIKTAGGEDTTAFTAFSGSGDGSGGVGVGGVGVGGVGGVVGACFFR